MATGKLCFRIPLLVTTMTVPVGTYLAVVSSNALCVNHNAPEETYLLTGNVERAAGANTVALPELGLGAAALAVLLGMVAGVPDRLIVSPVNFLADLDGGPVDRDKVLFVSVLHENFLRSICLERRKP